MGADCRGVNYMIKGLVILGPAPDFYRGERGWRLNQ